MNKEELLRFKEIISVTEKYSLGDNNLSFDKSFVDFAKMLADYALSTFDNQASVYKDVTAERKRQDEKWGEQNYHPIVWMSILTEEVGEAAKEVNEFTFNNKSCEDMKKELIQVAAVSIAFIEYLERNNIQ